MASTQEPVETEEKKNSRRRRAPGGRARRPRSGEAKAADGTAKPAAAADGSKEPRAPRPPRPESLPVPADLIDKKASGRITAVVRRGRYRYGFIHIGNKDTPEAELPRIFFSFNNAVDRNVTLRRHYLVEFTCSTDDKGRTHATNIALTPEGKVAAAAMEAAFAERAATKQAEKPAAAAAAATGDAAPAPKKERAPRERKPPAEGRKINLRITCEGKTGEKKIEFDTAQSVGRLKSLAAAEFEAPLTHNVFNLTTESPTGVFLTKAILSTLENDARIHLAAPPATEKN